MRTRSKHAMLGRMSVAGVRTSTVVALVALVALAVAAADSGAAFPGRNGQIAFAAGKRSSAGDIPLDLFLMPAQGGAARRLVAGASAAAWSPDGRKLAYAVGDYQPEVVVMDVVGGTTSLLTKNAFPDSSPAWSPDGRRLAFIRRPGPMDTPYRIIEAAATGGGERTLRTVAREPAFSPDGRWLAYVGDSSPQVFVVAASGAGTVRKLTSGFLWAVNPEWSPDGRQVAFAAQVSESQTPQIYVVRSDGGGLRRLTSSAGEKNDPAWSPDGTLVAFANKGPHGIFVVPANGGAERRLTPPGSPLWYFDLSWQPLVR